MQLLSDLLISRGIDPSTLEKDERCRICRIHGPELHDNYECSEEVCHDLWGELGRLHWETNTEREKKDIKEVFRESTKAVLDTVLGRNRP